MVEIHVADDGPLTDIISYRAISRGTDLPPVVRPATEATSRASRFLHKMKIPNRHKCFLGTRLTARTSNTPRTCSPTTRTGEPTPYSILQAKAIEMHDEPSATSYEPRAPATAIERGRRRRQSLKLAYSIHSQCASDLSSNSGPHGPSAIYTDRRHRRKHRQH